MARKNLIEISAPNPARADAVALRDNRPIAGFVPQERSAAPVGGITKTLGNITEKMERASELERQLASGQTIIELDPGLIDASFVSDRLAIDAAELAQLVEQIREHACHQRLTRRVSSIGHSFRATVFTIADRVGVIKCSYEHSIFAK